MAVITPTVMAGNEHQYREQMERVAGFAGRIHVDFMDGSLTDTTSIDLGKAWWPDNVLIVVHLMYKYPAEVLSTLAALQPELIILHAEAEGNFVVLADTIHKANIRVGVALLKDTPVEKIEPSIDLIDHVLIFSGDLGHFGGKTDLSLLKKVHELKRLKPSIEIGWDGGINDENARELAQGGVDVLNVGGYIQRADNAKTNYDKLKSLTKI